jgi:hypothetical protein
MIHHDGSRFQAVEISFKWLGQHMDGQKIKDQTVQILNLVLWIFKKYKVYIFRQLSNLNSTKNQWLTILIWDISIYWETIFHINKFLAISFSHSFTSQPSDLKCMADTVLNNFNWINLDYTLVNLFHFSLCKPSLHFGLFNFPKRAFEINTMKKVETLIGQ